MGTIQEDHTCHLENFRYLLDLIKGDDLFNKIRSGKKFPVQTQLAIVLYRLGSSGEGATLSKIAGLFGISDGGIIQNLTECIFNALLKYKDQYLFWPNTEERKKLVLEASSELPNCIGYFDGTEIPLAEKRSQDPEAYFSRKHIYSVKAQAVCDHRLQIRHLILGFPGSVHDTRIFNNRELSIEAHKFFGEGEWIAGDSAYKLSSTVITPFRENSRNLTLSQRNFFNKTFSRYRIRIEHCFGMLKERFGSLKGLRLQIKNENGMRKVNKCILCCALLHNFILQQDDYSDYQPEESEHSIDESSWEPNARTNEGEIRRREIFEQMFNQ